MVCKSLARACAGIVAAIGLSLAATGSSEAHELDHGWGRYPARGHHVHHHAAGKYVHKAHRKSRPANRDAVKRYRMGSWHCNPWSGARMLHGQRFVLGKGYHYGACLEHQTHVAADWRMWQAHDRERGRIHWHSHREHNWLKNADLRRRVR